MALKPEPEWYGPSAELIAREGLTLREALSRLGILLPTDQAAEVFRSKPFQRVLRAARMAHFAEVGSDPAWRKKTAIGQLLVCVQRLMEQEEFDKAAEVILKAARIEGWLGGEGNVNIFAGLTAKELEELKRRNMERTEEGEHEHQRGMGGPGKGADKSKIPIN